jgi:hypothetical protein
MMGIVYHTGTGLDRLLGGGIQTGKALIVSGPPGAGKSLVGLMFLSRGMERGEAGLYVSFSKLPLSSILLEARSYPRFSDLLSSEEPLFMTSDDAGSVMTAIGGVDRVVLDHPEALAQADPRWIEGLSGLISTCRDQGAGIMVLTYEERSPLLYICDGIVELKRTEGRQQGVLLKWPNGQDWVVEEKEAGEWMR